MIKMPGVNSHHEADGYSPTVGAVFVFNLIVGTGALTIPAAFSDAGWVVGIVVMLVIALMSYMTTTFVIESMSAANAIMQIEKLSLSSFGAPSNSMEPNKYIANNRNADYDESINNIVEAIDSTNETSTLLSNDEFEKDTYLGINSNLYAIDNRVEMGQMASIFLHKIGVIFFYLSICIYLFGDLAIYGTAVCKTLRDITWYKFSLKVHCLRVWTSYFMQSLIFHNSSEPSNSSCNNTLKPSDTCWQAIPITRINAYRMYLAIFCLTIGPLVFFNVQKTKFLQIFTTILRWISFTTMIVLALIHLSRGNGLPVPRAAHFEHLPNLFGVCVYSFMCHHSLPSLITPITRKTNVYRMMAMNYLCILTFYLLLALTGVFSFENVKDLYTLNFEPDRCNPGNPDLIANSVVLQYFLLLFPVFTISPNFPIIGITLKNNLIQLINLIFRGRPTSRLLEVVILPLLTIIPPLLVSIATEELQWLVGITGSFAGVGIQYMIPTMLVIWSRKMCNNVIGSNVKNPFQSPFRHNIWPVFALIWSIGCITFNVIRMLMNLYQSYKK